MKFYDVNSTPTSITSPPFAMHHDNTSILQQLQHLLPLYEFDQFVRQHRADRYVKKLTCRNQLTIMLYAQARGKDSLRDIETGLRVLDSSWYHLGLSTAARSTIAYANEHRPWQLYESLFYALLKKCKTLMGSHREFTFDNPLYALDSSIIDLCLSLFPWAQFSQEKGGIKLHTVFNIRSQVPELIHVTEQTISDMGGLAEIDLSTYAKGTIFVFDRAYKKFTFLQKIKAAGHYFIVRTSKNRRFKQQRRVYRQPWQEGVIADELVRFRADKAKKDYPGEIRLVRYYSQEMDKTFEFMTNSGLSAKNVAAVYRKRWDIELFFRWIKYNLKIRTFLGTSKNAVLTQIWIAMIYYLLLSWIKVQTKFAGNLLELTRMIGEVLMKKVHLIELISLTYRSLHKIQSRSSPQLILF